MLGDLVFQIAKIKERSGVPTCFQRRQARRQLQQGACGGSRLARRLNGRRHRWYRGELIGRHWPSVDPGGAVEPAKRDEEKKEIQCEGELAFAQRKRRAASSPARLGIAIWDAIDDTAGSATADDLAVLWT
jgi:hypothetical protein